MGQAADNVYLLGKKESLKTTTLKISDFKQSDSQIHIQTGEDEPLTNNSILSGTMAHRRGQTTLEISALGPPLISGITTTAGYLTWAAQMNSSKNLVI